MNKTYVVPEEAISVPTDQAILELGQHWVSVLCTECHGEDLGGTAFFRDPAIGTVNRSNLTADKGGASAEMSDSELAVAIRQGVDHDGRGLVIMPFGDFYYLSDEDLGAIIAYMRHAPPVGREWSEPKLTLMGRVLVGLGVLGHVSAAEVIDYNAPRPSAPAVGVTVEYGQYLVRIGGCATCHGKELSGDKGPEPGAPPSPNLTPGGELNAWSEADFISAMRIGVSPGGHQISSKFMPWKGIGQMTDNELKALWLYLQSLPARQSTSK